MSTHNDDEVAGTEATRVLVVDDDLPFANACKYWLEDDYDVRVASTGVDALAAVDPSVDIALIDRRLDAMTGADVLDAIRDAGYDCRVAMMTAVEPNEGIVDMPFDEYLVKPVTGSDVRETVERLDVRSEYDDDIQDYFAVTAKIAALETEYTELALAESAAYERLTERAAALHQRTADRLADVDGFETAFLEVEPR